MNNTNHEIVFNVSAIAIYKSQSISQEVVMVYREKKNLRHISTVAMKSSNNDFKQKHG